MGCCSRPKRAARGYRNTKNFIAIAYLRMSKLVHLTTSPFEAAQPAVSVSSGDMCEVKLHSEHHRARNRCARHTRIFA